MKLLTKSIAVLSGAVLFVPAVMATESATATAAVTSITAAGEDVVAVGAAIIGVTIILYGISKLRQLGKG